MFFSKIFRRCYSTVEKTELEKDCTAVLLAPTPSGIGAAFSLGRVFPVEAEMYSTVQLWFIFSHLRRPSEELD